MRSWNIRAGLLLWAGASVVGVLIVALPDRSRLFSISARHGPSALDTVGVGVLLLAWITFLIPLWRSRAAIGQRRLLAALAVGAAGLTFWSVTTDRGNWWMVGSAVLVLVQVVAGMSVIRRGA